MQPPDPDDDDLYEPYTSPAPDLPHFDAPQLTRAQWDATYLQLSQTIDPNDGSSEDNAHAQPDVHSVRPTQC